MRFSGSNSFRLSRIRPLALVLVALAWLSPASNAQCPLTFDTAVNYAAGGNPYSVAVGDFNADGRRDLVVANQGSNNISILLGNANGTFAAPVNYAVGSRPLFVAVGDLNGDGRPDLAVVNNGNNNVSILLQNANGTFAAGVSYAVGTSPYSVAAGDFNGDGRLDLAVTNSSNLAGGNSVSILLQNANGTFAAAVNYAVGTQPFFVVVGDFNADGRRDLAVANASSSNVSILLGNANGTFAAAANYATGALPYSIALGDFNGDGRPDLAVANFTGNNLSVLAGNANGTFAAAVNLTAGSSPVSVAVGDFNGDGQPDLAVANYGGNVSVFLNTNTGLPPPVIVQQPASQIVQSGQNATITVIASGNTLTYQWRKGGVVIANGGNISGATSPTLSFTPARLVDFASYDVQVTSPPACGMGAKVTTSAASVLGVHNPCPADFNNDGVSDFFDYLDFVQAFSTGC